MLLAVDPGGVDAPNGRGQTPEKVAVEAGHPGLGKLFQCRSAKARAVPAKS